MVTITLCIGINCNDWETEICNAIQQLLGEEEDVEVEVLGQRVVVEGCITVSASRIITELYHKLGLRFEEEEDDDDDEDSDSDDGGDGGDSDDDDDSDDDGDDDDGTYLQMGSLSLYGNGLRATAIPEPSWEDQPVADPSPYFF